MKGIACMTADPSFMELSATQRLKCFRKVKYVPELGMEPPTVTRREARDRLGLAEDDRVI